MPPGGYLLQACLIMMHANFTICQTSQPTRDVHRALEMCCTCIQRSALMRWTPGRPRAEGFFVSLAGDLIVTQTLPWLQHVQGAHETDAGASYVCHILDGDSSPQ